MTEHTGRGGPARPVGIVLVSHSAEAAEAVVRLAAALAGGAAGVPLEPAGGLPDGGLGTSAERITEAARRADRGAGVAVLADLGSAVLTVRALLAEDAGGGLPPDTRLLDAPFLEGAVGAAVTAAAGGDLAAVTAAAEDAYRLRKR